MIALVAKATTIIPVRPETLAHLRSYKVSGATYDDVLNDLMDDQRPAGFIREHLRRLREETFSEWRDMQKRSRALLDCMPDERASEEDIVAKVREWRSKKGHR